MDPVRTDRYSARQYQSGAGPGRTPYLSQTFENLPTRPVRGPAGRDPDWYYLALFRSLGADCAFDVQNDAVLWWAAWRPRDPPLYAGGLRPRDHPKKD